MNHTLIRILSNTESNLLAPLYNECCNRFAGKNLPSHDHTHHMRVWHFARNLLASIQREGTSFTLRDVTLLMLAVMFHDTGLTINLGEFHGKESRRICEEFLEKNNDLIRFNPIEALEAIEHHDKKDSNHTSVMPEGINIHKLLTICDDLDAYGFTGILRYAEIYLLREITYDEIGTRVINNLNHRWTLFISQQWIPGEFVNIQFKRYEITKGFYLKFLAAGSSAGYNSYRSIIEKYMERVYNQGMELDLFAGTLRSENDPVINSFGQALEEELSEYL